MVAGASQLSGWGGEVNRVQITEISSWPPTQYRRSRIIEVRSVMLSPLAAPYGVHRSRWLTGNLEVWAGQVVKLPDGRPTASYRRIVAE